eukprot:scaffold21197_cov49-Cylindrotheca_fusiformis.AAC.1
MSLKEQIENLEQQLEGENANVDVEAIANELAELYDRQEDLDVSSEREIQLAIERMGFSKFLEKPVSQLSSGW